ncbi:hypothetical protein ElyMa_002674700 [Elysia marginata]|uniref:Uncharacterized protein n=1 Tax=Elysia marginata TaxID=1093978 RepID=A0AAV4HD38_9GAST|nr:hypothetical protein ElyMa_002674700 [Elysia marginata]
MSRVAVLLWSVVVVSLLCVQMGAAMDKQMICARRCLYGRGGILCRCNAMHFTGKRAGSSNHTPVSRYLGDELRRGTTSQVKVTSPDEKVKSATSRREFSEWDQFLRRFIASLKKERESRRNSVPEADLDTRRIRFKRVYPLTTWDRLQMDQDRFHDTETELGQRRGLEQNIQEDLFRYSNNPSDSVSPNNGNSHSRVLPELDEDDGEAADSRSPFLAEDQVASSEQQADITRLQDVLRKAFGRR